MAGELDGGWLAERDRLVRLCTAISGRSDAAEDLAQETLIEAWRCRHKLVDQQGRSAWLAAIARNVCLRWARRQARDLSHLLAQPAQLALDGIVLDDVSIEDELEREELALLLREALDLIPAGARSLLIERFLESRSMHELATRAGISEAALAMRLQRAKHALRKVLDTRLRDEAVELGLLLPAAGWQTSKVWCWCCGQARLRVSADGSTGELIVCCPSCHTRTVDHLPGLAGTRGHWRLIRRSLREAHGYFRQALSRGSAPCGRCGHPAALRLGLPPPVPEQAQRWGGVHLACSRCGTISQQPAVGLAQTLPEVERFWRMHRRIHLASQEEGDHLGAPMVRTRFASVSGSAMIDILTRRDSFDVLAVHQS